MQKTFPKLDKEKTKIGNWVHQKKSGELMVMEIMSFPFQFEDKECSLVFAKDITDKMPAEQKLEKANKELNEKIIKIQSYAFANSHKVRAPLANLIGLLDILELEQKPELIEMLKISAQTLDKEVKQMNEILTDQSILKT